MHIEILRPGTNGSWYWHFKNKGRITADAESFPTKANAVRAAKAVVTGVVKELAQWHTPLTFKTVKVDDRLFHVTWS